MSSEDVFKNEELPEGWSLCTVGATCSAVTDGTHKTPNYAERGIRFLSTANLVPFKEGFDFTGYERFISKDDHELLIRRCRPEYGDVLVSKCGTIGRTKEVDVDFPFSIFVGLALLKPLKGLFAPAFLEVFLNSPQMQAQLDSLSPGSTRRTLTIGGLKSAELPLPPLPEQVRIVERVRGLVAGAASIASRLSRIPPILKRFRQSVLAAACSGKLTAEWREGRSLQSGSSLLERLLLERKRLWEDQQYKAVQLRGRHNPKKCYEMPEPAVVDDLPELPEGWAWASVDSLSTKVVDGVHKKPTYVDSGVPFVTVRNLTAGRGISFDSLNHITPADHAKFVERANPEQGDILVTKDGTLGVVRAIRTNRVFSIFVSVALIKLVSKEMTDYMEIALSSPQVQRQMVGTGSGLQHIHLRDLRADCVPLPPLEEQREIVRRVNAFFKLTDVIENRVSVASARSDKLTESILAKAFRGELVPTEAELAQREGRDYEPASVLLERIRGKRANEQKSPEVSKRKLKHSNALVRA